MKYRFFFLLLISVLIGCSHNSHEVVGEWRGIDHSGKLGSVIFDNTDHFTILAGNDVMGGKEYMFGGRKCET